MKKNWCNSYLNLHLQSFMQNLLLNMKNNQKQTMIEIFQLIEKQLFVELLPTKNILVQTMHKCLKENYFQIKIQLKKLYKNYSLSLQQTAKFRTQQILQRIYKLQEFYLYCTIQKRKNNQLQIDVQKYFSYERINQNITQEIQNYLTQPIIFELIFKQYFATENPNIFIADLMDFFWLLTIYNLLPFKRNHSSSYIFQRKQDLICLDKKNIIFKQLYQLNQKYCSIKKYLNSSYINMNYLKIINFQNKNYTSTQQQSNNLIYNKIQKLQYLTKKLINSNKSTVSYTKNVIINDVQVIPQSLSNFIALSQQFTCLNTTINQVCKIFLEKLFTQQPMINKIEQKQFEYIQIQNSSFEFMKKIIIKTDVLFYLNQLLSSFNLISYIYCQISGKIIDDQHIFQFMEIQQYLRMNFNLSNKSFYKSYKYEKQSKNKENNSNIYIQIDDKNLWYLQYENKKIIYPSAINNLIHFLKFLVLLMNKIEIQDKNYHFNQEQKNNNQSLENINFKDQQKILNKKQFVSIFDEQLQFFQKISQIVKLWSNLIRKWAQIFHNIHTIIHNKQMGCYIILSNYITTVLSSTIYSSLLQQNENNYCSKIYQFIQKVHFITQIFYQLNTTHEIYPVLNKLFIIQSFQRNHNYSTKNIIDFYSGILDEIIQVRNNLKLEHSYSLNLIHQQFAYFTKSDGSFDKLLINFSRLCTDNLLVQKLFRLFAIQLRIKRMVFKAQLYWNLSQSEQINNDNENQYYESFIDFIEDTAKILISLNNEPLSYFLQNCDEFEQHANKLDKEIQRVCLIQLISTFYKNQYQNNVQQLKKYLRKLSYIELNEIIWALKNNNYIDQFFMNRNSCKYILQNLKNCIDKGHNFPLKSLKQYQYKQRLSSLILITKIYSFTYVDNSFQFINDTNTVIHYLRDKKDILLFYEKIIKQPTETLKQMIKYYSLLLLLAWLQISNINDTNISIIDNRIINSLLLFLQQYKYFQKLDDLEDILMLEKTLFVPNEIYNLKRIIIILKNYLFQSTQDQYNHNNILQQCLKLRRQISSYCGKIIFSKIKYIQIKIGRLGQTNDLIKYVNQYVQKLQLYVNSFFLQSINKILQKYQISFKLNEQITILQNIKILYQKLLQNLNNSQQHYNLIERKQIILFDQLIGYEIKLIQEKQQQQYLNICNINLKNRNHKLQKKVIFAPSLENQNQFKKLLNNIEKKVKMEIIKQTMQSRKFISYLQIQDRIMTDEIIWQTCKLKYNAINKIKKFIAESNIDQQQSYINFKHTVNLQTCKGMQKVINDQTQLYRKSGQQNKLIKKQYNQQYNQNNINKNTILFVTSLLQKQQKKIIPDIQKILQNKHQQILAQSVNIILEHKKKIKFFTSWKVITQKNDITISQWKKFNINIGIIFNNYNNLKTIIHIQQLKNQYENENIECYLLKQQNKGFNQRIKLMKMKKLEKKITSYRFKDMFKNKKKEIS